MIAVSAADVRKLVVACDAGMGSGVMLARMLQGELADTPVVVEQAIVNAIPRDADVVLCHESLSDRARVSAASRPVVVFRRFLGDPAVQQVVRALKRGDEIRG